MYSSKQDSQSNKAPAEVDTMAIMKGSPDFKAKEAICARIDSVCTVSLLGS